MTKKTLVLLMVLMLILAGCAQRATPILTPTARPTTPAPSAAAPTVTPLPVSTSTVTPSPLPRLPTSTRLPPVGVEIRQVHSAFLGGERTISVYLPGDYSQRPDRRYKVLYAFDAQELPQIAFEQYLNLLVMDGRMEPLIVVAVHSAEGDLRHEELGAGPYINVFGWGTLSDAFNKFMVSELPPTIARAYRTLPGAQNTGIMGWSLGGLAAFYLAWQYPDTFGIVGAFSPSFWWRTTAPAGYELQNRVAHKIVREGAAHPGMRIWLEAGTHEEPRTDIDKNGVPDVIQDVQDLIILLEQKGFKKGTDLVYVQVEGGRHETTTWARVMPDFLTWAFPVK